MVDVAVTEHDEAPPEDGEPISPTCRVRFVTGPVRDVARVVERLSTPSEMLTTHPLLTRVEPTGERHEHGVHVIDFALVEQVPVLGGLLRISNRYRGRATRFDAHPQRVRLSGWSFPGVRIEVRFEVRDGQLIETAWVAAPWFVRGFVHRTFIDAHRHLVQAVLED
ncbi:MAG: hypothetical protein ACOZQL_42250 [Myxococcota bacterium]